MTEKKEKSSDIIMGPDMCQDVWEVVRTNRASGKPSMVRLKVNEAGGVIQVTEVRVCRRDDKSIEEEEDQH